ncbi:hypothetical protein [Streptodolium elevatio]|uniref:Uncharacterized protein n=1 Tax=Streptodolium elevatio TaxID=3157996 RepID=A0ABV3DM16_9ACTN
MSLPASSSTPPPHRPPTDRSSAPSWGLTGFRLMVPEPADPVVRMTLHRATGTVELGLTRGAGGQAEALEAAFDAVRATVVARLDLSAGALELSVRLRHNHVAGDIGILVLEWAPGGDARRGGSATDVVRRAPDGFWRYAVPLPLGGPTPS